MTKILKQKNYQIIPFEFERKIEDIANDIKIKHKDVEKQIENIKKEREKEIVHEKEINSTNKEKEEEYNERISLCKSKLRWKLKRTNGRHLFSYINNLIYEQDIPARIGIAIELDFKDGDCSKLGISKNNEFKRVIRKGSDKYEFKYDFINLYLFETGVGFLVYSLEFCNDSKVKIDDIIEGNYYYKKYNEDGIYEGYLSEINKRKEYYLERKRKFEEINLADNSNKKIIEKYKSRAEKAEENLKRVEALEKLIEDEEEKSSKDDKEKRRARWVELILEDLNLGKTKFIGTEKDASYSHVFSYINLEEETSEYDINRYLYWLKNSYKKTYKPTYKILNDKNQEGYLRLFENVWWGASIEGLTCITKYTKNDKLTNTFINTYNGTIGSIYLYMYILMLHMRYALLKYIIEAADINKEIKNYEESDIKKINELKEKIILLDLRCIFNDVSNISSQVKVFDMMRESLRIDRLNKELYKEIENLSELANLYYKKKLLDKEKKDREEKELQKQLEEKRIYDAREEEEKREKIKSESLETIYYVIGALAVSSFIKDIIESFEYSYPWIYLGLVVTSIIGLIWRYKYIKKKN